MTTAVESPNIKPLAIEEEMKDSYLNYAMSVIVARALPDVRDGLKPSQRRVLVAMNDLGLGPRAKHRKCAKIAGDTSGNYHPHGEQVVYPTLVRLAQDFVMRYPLVEGQGNFGSIDGDPPAAMRYTEARMTEFTMLMLEDIDKNTVNYVPNYDQTREEPTVLPSKFPNLLCSGSMGIAVGMATSIPPHNLVEVCDAIIKLIEKPDATVAELMAFVKGPDFPTGGIICGVGGIREAYETGKGHITVRAKITTEESKNKTSIIVTEIPYNQSKAGIIETAARLVKEDRLRGISDIRDESDRDGIRVVIEPKRGEDVNVIINQLYELTPLQDTFAINVIALVDRRPQQLNLKEVLVEYKKHRIEVIRRRTQFLLEKAQDEAHILEGLAKALDFIDEVIAIIKKSKTPAEASQALITRFELSAKQAEAILRMTLQRLTGLEQEKIRKELAELLEKIAEYKSILADERLILDIIREDLFEMKEKYKDKRRTEISAEEVKDFHVEELIKEEDMVVVLSHEGYIKRVPLRNYRMQKRGGKGIISAETKELDFVEHLFVASTHDYILFFSQSGKVYRVKVYELPELSRTSKGKHITAILSLPTEEKIHEVIAIKVGESGFLVLATQKGYIKKTPLEEYDRITKAGKIAITLESDDKLIGVAVTNGSDEIILGTAKGQAIRFPEAKVRPMGRTAYGVTGIKFKAKDDKVVDMIILNKDSTLLTVSENGYCKRSAFDDYRRTARGGKGIRSMKVTEKSGNVIAMKAVKEEDGIMAITQKGIVLRTTVSYSEGEGIRVFSRQAGGVRLIKLDEGDKLISIARVEKEEDGEIDKTIPQKPATPIKDEDSETPTADEEE